MSNKPSPLVMAGVLLGAASMLVFGFWALLSPVDYTGTDVPILDVITLIALATVFLRLRKKGTS